MIKANAYHICKAEDVDEPLSADMSEPILSYDEAHTQAQNLANEHSVNMAVVGVEHSHICTVQPAQEIDDLVEEAATEEG